MYKKIEGTQEKEYYNKDYMDFKIFLLEIHYNKMLWHYKIYYNHLIL